MAVRWFRFRRKTRRSGLMGQNPCRRQERQSICGCYPCLPVDRRWDVWEGALGKAGGTSKSGIGIAIDPAFGSLTPSHDGAGVDVCLVDT